MSKLADLAMNPCSRCFKCEDKEADCMNPYKECSICAVIRRMAKDFSSWVAEVIEKPFNLLYIDKGMGQADEDDHYNQALKDLRAEQRKRAGL